jgi:hypothetical protein
LRRVKTGQISAAQKDTEHPNSRGHLGVILVSVSLRLEERVVTGSKMYEAQHDDALTLFDPMP